MSLIPHPREVLTSAEESLRMREMVAHTGFEPVIFALRGRCPWPLDECASYHATEAIASIAIPSSRGK